MELPANPDLVHLIVDYCFTDEKLNGNHPIERQGTSLEGGLPVKAYEIGSTEGFYFRFMEIPSSEKAKTITIENNAPCLLVHYQLSGKVVFQPGGLPETVFNPGHFNIQSICSPQKTSIHLSGTEPQVVFQCLLKTDFFLQHIPPDHPIYKAFTEQRRELCTGDGWLKESSLAISGRLREVLFEILHCPLEQRYKTMFLKAKMIEMMVLQMELYEQPVVAVPVFEGIKEADVLKMLEAKDILLGNLTSPPGIPELAMQVGTNENYLKKYFKIVNGNTVAGFILEARMQDARRKLEVKGLSLAETAAAAGYRHVHHFVAAFKKRFGVRPSQLKSLLWGVWPAEEVFALMECGWVM